MRKSCLIAAIFMAAAAMTPASAQPPAPAFETDSYVLYLPDHAMRERGPSVELLAAYLKAVETQAATILSKQQKPASQSISLVIGLKPGGKSKLWVVAADPTEAARLEALLAPAVERIPVPGVRGYNAFAINADLWGGNGRMAETPPIPEAWKSAMPDGGMLPDAPLSVLMPD